MRNLGLVLVLLMAACTNIEAYREAIARNEAANTTYPQNYKADILLLLRTYLNDPRQVRDAGISDPVIKIVDGSSRYVVCVRYNAKKDGGQYAGSKVSLFTFREGRLDRILDPAREPRDTVQIREQCKDVALKPFAELEKLSR